MIVHAAEITSMDNYEYKTLNLNAKGYRFLFKIKGLRSQVGTNPY
jgi:hypothetical protein